MATTARAAPWRTLFQTHLTKNTSTTFTISTISPSPSPDDPQNAHAHAHAHALPRARVCEFRGFWPSPTLHPSAIESLNAQCGGPNPTVWESDMLSFTTDARMAKAQQLEASGHVAEGVFWLSDVMNQWRVRGRAYIIGDGRGGRQEEEARREVLKGMRRVSGSGSSSGGDGGDGDGGWSWEKQVTTYFANHSPTMRGSFKNPPPGTPRSEAPTDPGLKLGQKVEDLHDPVARANFRVVVMRPIQVERLDLSDLQNVRRQQWTFVEDKEGPGRWEEVELWP